MAKYSDLKSSLFLLGTSRSEHLVYLGACSYNEEKMYALYSTILTVVVFYRMSKYV